MQKPSDVSPIKPGTAHRRMLSGTLWGLADWLNSFEWLVHEILTVYTSLGVVVV